jgi:hypothetical protein
LFPILILIKHPKETSDNNLEKTMPATKLCKNDLLMIYADGTISDA